MPNPPLRKYRVVYDAEGTDATSVGEYLSTLPDVVFVIAAEVNECIVAHVAFSTRLRRPGSFFDCQNKPAAVTPQRNTRDFVQWIRLAAHAVWTYHFSVGDCLMKWKAVLD